MLKSFGDTEGAQSLQDGDKQQQGKLSRLSRIDVILFYFHQATGSTSYEQQNSHAAHGHEHGDKSAGDRDALPHPHPHSNVHSSEAQHTNDCCKQCHDVLSLVVLLLT